MENKTLPELVQLTQTGNLEAKELLCLRLKAQIESSLKSTFKDSEIVNDLAQETYLRLLRSFESIREPVKIRHFVAKITLFVINDYFRSHASWNNKITIVENPQLESQRRADILSEEASADRNISLQEILERVRNRIDKSILQYRIEGKTFKEIASLLSLTEGAAKMRYKRTVEHLKKRLKL